MNLSLGRIDCWCGSTFIAHDLLVASRDELLPKPLSDELSAPKVSKEARHAL